METLLTAEFWIGIFKIIWIDVILSGDNAVVIALAARSLPPEQQRKAILWGCGFAIALRISLTVVAAKLMQFPFLEIVGGCLLLWIGVGLLKGEDSADETSGNGKGNGGIFTAIRTILLADLVMCLDNVIAVAATAQGDMTLLIFGLALSIPLVLFGSTLMIKLMERFPWIVMLGAGLIGWVAGETIVNDHILHNFSQQYPAAKYAAAVCGAAFVLFVGHWLKQRKTQKISV
ncbi:TerC family protein [Comamonas sp. NoAH]|uniref:TerC family protein n=1 Tax=Comamonas halotolerans TaxID=3041496 RepID=UPI0024E11C2A|nr:TerC family protein [Comamonas sp. NoAH]